MEASWGLRNLGRRPARTALSLVGIAVASAMLLDMVMLSGGIEQSFARLLLGRGFQIRMTPKGMLPFDAEAAIPHAGRVLDSLRADPAISAAGGVLGGNVYVRHGDSLIAFVAYGVDPEAQALYELEAGRDLAPGDSAGLLISPAAAAAVGAGVGDTIDLVATLDPQLMAARSSSPMVARGTVRWLYDYRGQRSLGLTRHALERLTGRTADDPASVIMVKVRDGVDPDSAAARLRVRFPRLEVGSVNDLVVSFRRRMLYFRQLSLILGTVSLAVTVLLVATLMTITVNERLGEIATLRAIGVARAAIVIQVIVEGSALTALGSAAGLVLGLATARYLDAILTSFPGLPAAFSFFVPRPGSIAVAAAALLLTGCLAGVYPAWLAARAPIAATLRAEAT